MSDNFIQNMLFDFSTTDYRLVSGYLEIRNWNSWIFLINKYERSEHSKALDEIVYYTNALETIKENLGKSALEIPDFKTWMDKHGVKYKVIQNEN